MIDIQFLWCFAVLWLGVLCLSSGRFGMIACSYCVGCVWVILVLGRCVVVREVL